jgi:hypothetical protein
VQITAQSSRVDLALRQVLREAAVRPGSHEPQSDCSQYGPRTVPRTDQIGRVYALAIFGVLVSALPLTAHAFLKGQTVAGAFLSYLVI